MRLPIIVGMGGVNAAGRTSDFQSFRRMVIDVLPEEERQRTLVGLAVMMGLVSPEGEKHVRVTVAGEINVKLDNLRDFPFKAAGQLPSGFDISKLYNSRFQPRGLQMALFGATDALRSMGIEWETNIPERELYG